MPSAAPNIGTSVLRALHRVHRQLTDLRERLDRGPRQIRVAETHVQHCENRLAAAKAEAKTLRMAADQKQLQLKSNEDKVKDLRRKLNAATSNREYQLLIEQIAADDMANSVLADEILEVLEKVEGFQKNVGDAEAALAAAKQKAAEVRGEVARSSRRSGPTSPGSKPNCSRRKRLCRPTSAISTIAIVRQKGEDALAVIEGQCCGGCNQQIPLNSCNLVMLGQPVTCKTCGRLLYMPE